MVNTNSINHKPYTINHLFLLRHFYKGKTKPLTEESFTKVLGCRRMARLREMRKMHWLDRDEEEYIAARKNMPHIGFMVQQDEYDNWQWNGCILVSCKEVSFAQRVVENHAEELNIIFAFRESDYDRYYMVVASDSKERTEESFNSSKTEVVNRLHKYFPHLTCYSLHFFCRLPAPEYIDLIEESVCFPESEEVHNPYTLNHKPSCITSLPNNNSEKSSTNSLRENVKTFVSRLLHT